MYKAEVNREANRVATTCIKLTPKGKGLLNVKRNQARGMQRILLDSDRASFIALDCIILTALRDSIYVINEGKPRLLKNDKSVAKIASDRIYGVIDLGKHTAFTSNSDMKGKGGKHRYEYPVRGFWRTYKSGKKVWVNSYTRCKGRESVSRNINIINVEKSIEIRKGDIE